MIIRVQIDHTPRNLWKLDSISYRLLQFWSINEEFFLVLKARETLNEIIRSYEPSHHVPALFEKHYELPNHTVKVRELLSEDIANENNWIGENKV